MEGNNSNDSVNLAVNLGEGADASRLNGSDPNYIRELRFLITKAAFRGERLDGKMHSPSAVAALAGHILRIGERAGLSGEDTMTLLAYNALLNYEKSVDLCIEYSNLNVSPRTVKP